MTPKLTIVISTLSLRSTISNPSKEQLDHFLAKNGRVGSIATLPD